MKRVWVAHSTGPVMGCPSCRLRGSTEEAGRCAVLWRVQVECGSIVRVNRRSLRWVAAPEAWNERQPTSAAPRRAHEGAPTGGER